MYGLPATRGYRGVYGKFKRYPHELKALDTDIGGAQFVIGPTTANAGVFICNSMAQGSDYNQRIGREILLKSIEVHFDVLQGTTIATTPLQFRIVYDSQTNGVNVTGIQVQNDVALSGTGVPFVGTNLSNRDRFTTLYNKTKHIQVMNGNGTTALVNRVIFKFYKKLNHKVVYNASTAGVGSIQTGGLWLLFYGTLPSGATAANVGNGFCRIRYSDC